LSASAGSTVFPPADDVEQKTNSTATVAERVKAMGLEPVPVPKQQATTASASCVVLVWLEDRVHLVLFALEKRMNACCAILALSFAPQLTFSCVVDGGACTQLILCKQTELNKSSCHLVRGVGYSQH
jgi:hypothetical protein